VFDLGNAFMVISEWRQGELLVNAHFATLRTMRIGSRESRFLIDSSAIRNRRKSFTINTDAILIDSKSGLINSSNSQVAQNTSSLSNRNTKRLEISLTLLPPAKEQVLIDTDRGVKRLSRSSFANSSARVQNSLEARSLTTWPSNSHEV
jgi:hypothetical protein